MKDLAPPIERFIQLLEAGEVAIGNTSPREIAALSAPVVPVLDELSEADRAGDLTSFAFRECFSALTFLGRRLALLDLTATSALQIAEITLHASRHQGPERFSRRALAAVVEGFVMGREERVAENAQERAARSLRPIRLDARVVGLLVSGAHDALVLSRCVDALGQAMLDLDAETAIVDLSQLGEPDRERAAAIFSAEQVARMLGGICLFSGVDANWRRAATEAHLAWEELTLFDHVADALEAARATAQETKRSGPRWRTWLRR